MKKLPLKKILVFLPLTFLTSCGYSLDYIVEGNRYNSAIFKDNFYSHWDDELKNAKHGENVTVENAIYSFSDLYKIDPLMVTEDYDSADAYGADYKMNGVDDMFNYGYQSKLFDGQVQCLGYYQLARVQTDKDGFSMRFKATTDNTVACYKYNSDELAKNDQEMFHNSSIDLTIGLYTKNDANEIVKNRYTVHVDFQNNTTNRGSYYVFLAFSLKPYNLSRLVGLSFEYTYDDELINWNKEKGIDIDYSLMLYEVFFPYTNWQ